MNFVKRWIIEWQVKKAIGRLDMSLGKGWRTVGVNVLAGLSFFLGWEQITQWVSAEHVAALLAAINIAMRLITTTAVGKSG
jgi:hypothetical protein